MLLHLVLSKETLKEKFKYSILNLRLPVMFVKSNKRLVTVLQLICVPYGFLSFTFLFLHVPIWVSMCKEFGKFPPNNNNHD